MSPTSTNGKICYIEIPAIDVERSAVFYEEVFGWNIRPRGDGATAFDDTTGEVSGTWVTGRPSSTDPGLLIYVMVEQRRRHRRGRRRPRRPDRPADRRRRTRDNCEIPRPSGERGRPLPGTEQPGLARGPSPTMLRCGRLVNWSSIAPS